MKVSPLWSTTDLNKYQMFGMELCTNVLGPNGINPNHTIVSNIKYEFWVTW